MLPNLPIQFAPPIVPRVASEPSQPLAPINKGLLVLSILIVFLEPLLPPCATVYIKNLNDKIKITGFFDCVERFFFLELKNTLRQKFSECGTILDVVCMSSFLRKGQAFIVFANEDEAKAAINSFQHEPIFGKPMFMNFAKNKSYVTLVNEGIDVNPLKKKAKAESL
jgi:RNA recognition motif-containing protein